MAMFWIGKKVPKGYLEESAIHLGRGMWIFRIKKVIQCTKKEKDTKG